MVIFERDRLSDAIRLPRATFAGLRPLPIATAYPPPDPGCIPRQTQGVNMGHLGDQQKHK